MKEFRFIFLRLCLYLITGIISAFWLRVDTPILLYSIGVLLTIYLILFIRSRKQIFQGNTIGVMSFVMIFTLGYGVTHFRIPENQPQHYIHASEPENALLRSEVSEVLKPTSFFERYIINSRSLYSDELKSVHGKLLLNIPKDTLLENLLKPGDVILTPFKSEAIAIPLNPYQFDYGNYLKHLKIEKQLSIQPGEIEIIADRQTLFSFAQGLREEIIKKLRRYDLSQDELAVFQALILGQKRDITPQLYKNYANAGALHILAISGLHIGILLLFLNYLLQPFEKLKHGKILKTVLLILSLWGFALLTGLNPSVVRAVGMFSFIAVGMQLKRKTSALNGLFLSLFFLLLIDPYYIFQVGFQLSYLAVFSIIVFQPLIYRQLNFRLKILDYFWKLVSVSLAAQIGILPLSIFYFHQFPGLFLISNLFILPFLGIILGFGICIIILSQIDLLPQMLLDSFGKMLALMNEIVTKIASFDQFIISGLSLSKIQLIAFYAIILGIILILNQLNFSRIAFILVSIIIFQLNTIWQRQNIPLNQMLIYHVSGESLIVEKDRNKALIFGNPGLNDKSLDWQRENRIKQISNRATPQSLSSEEKILFIIDTMVPLTNYKVKPELILLKDSPKINLERLIDSLQPQILIADGSNYKTYIRLWKNTAETKKIPFHYTGEKGAFILNHKN